MADNEVMATSTPKSEGDVSKTSFDLPSSGVKPTVMVILPSAANLMKVTFDSENIQEVKVTFKSDRDQSIDRRSVKPSDVISITFYLYVTIYLLFGK